MSALTLMADIVIVNMLLVVSCLPIVTAGAALRAANVVIRDMVTGVGANRSMLFLRELTRSWRPVTLYWFLLLGAGALVAYQQWVITRAGIGDVALTIIRALTLSGVLILTSITVWFFGWASTHARAQASFVDLFNTAVMSAFRYLGRTAAAVAIVVGAATLALGLPIGWAVPLNFFFLPAFALYLTRLVIARRLGEQPART